MFVLVWWSLEAFKKKSSISFYFEALLQNVSCFLHLTGPGALFVVTLELGDIYKGNTTGCRPELSTAGCRLGTILRDNLTLYFDTIVVRPPLRELTLALLR